MFVTSHQHQCYWVLDKFTPFSNQATFTTARTFLFWLQSIDRNIKERYCSSVCSGNYCKTLCADSYWVLIMITAYLVQYSKATDLINSCSCDTSVSNATYYVNLTSEWRHATVIMSVGVVNQRPVRLFHKLTEFNFTLANCKERCCLRLFHTYVMWTEFLSCTKPGAHHKTERVRTRATCHEQNASFLLDLFICGLLRN